MTSPVPGHLERSELVALVDAAGAAPSSHNTQPWMFRLRPDRVDLMADRTRALAVNDPHDRELAISCGAALFNLRAAARAAELKCAVEALPDDEQRDLLATVQLSRGDPANADEVALCEAIDQRRTCRVPFSDREVPLDIRQALTAAVRAEGARLRVVSAPAERARLIELITEGDRRQFADHRWRRELASWMHQRRRDDGLPVNEIALPLTRLLLSTVNLGRSTAADDANRAGAAPLLVILSTTGDGPRDWLVAGQALERMLLGAASQGLQASFFNQPCQIEELRPWIADLVGEGCPQLILGLGYLPASRATSRRRRPVDEILEGERG